MFKNLIWISALAIMGCDSDNSKHAEDFSEWKDNNITSYSFNYRTTGFSTWVSGGNTGTLRIQVHDNEVIHTQFTTDDSIVEDKSIDSAPTIDDLILRIYDCEESASCEVSVLELDETYSFPSQVNLSVGEEGDGFIVSEFEVQ